MDLTKNLSPAKKEKLSRGMRHVFSLFGLRVRARRVGFTGHRLTLIVFLFAALFASVALDLTVKSFSHWWFEHTLLSSLAADLLVFSISFGLYDQIIRVREARSLVRDHDLWNLRSRVDRAGESLTRALLIWQGEGSRQHLFFSGEDVMASADGSFIDLSRGRGRARYCSEHLPVALSDPEFFSVRCDHHRIPHLSLHECLLYDLEKLEHYLSEYVQRYRDTGYPDFQTAVDASEKCQIVLDAIVHQFRNIHNPHHPAKPSTILTLCDEYMETRHIVSRCAHTYGEPKSPLYTPLEPMG